MFFYSFSEWTFSNVLIRIAASFILGCVIGLDRGLKRRGAGTKTNTIVCLGATMVMLTGQYMAVCFGDSVDMSRMAAQVISGVGFLGVGTIMVTGHQVRGLTTAASLWACACIGLAVGIGFIDGGIIITICMLIALHVLPAIEKILYKRSRYISLYIEMENTHAVNAFLELMPANKIKIDSFDVVRGKTKEQPHSMQVILKLPTPYRPSYIELIESIEGVNSVEVL